MLGYFQHECTVLLPVLLHGCTSFLASTTSFRDIVFTESGRSRIFFFFFMGDVGSEWVNF